MNRVYEGRHAKEKGHKKLQGIFSLAYEFDKIGGFMGCHLRSKDIMLYVEDHGESSTLKRNTNAQLKPRS